MFRFVVGCMLVVVALSTGCSCCAKKGFVMRGDWSLEFNRVPHMKSNGPTYDGDCTTGCCESLGCAEGCSACDLSSGANADGAAFCRNGRCGRGRDIGAVYADAAADGAGHAPLGDRFQHGGPPGDGDMHGRGGRLRGRLGHEGMLGDATPLPPEPTPAAATRFHPVPTRPVFEPFAAADSGPAAVEEFSEQSPLAPRVAASGRRNSVAWRTPSGRG